MTEITGQPSAIPALLKASIAPGTRQETLELYVHDPRNFLAQVLPEPKDPFSLAISTVSAYALCHGLTVRVYDAARKIVLFHADDHQAGEILTETIAETTVLDVLHERLIRNYRENNPDENQSLHADPAGATAEVRFSLTCDYGNVAPLTFSRLRALISRSARQAHWVPVRP